MQDHKNNATPMSMDVSFLTPKISAKLNGVMPMGAPNTGLVGRNLLFLTNILLYFSNSQDRGYSYCGRL